MTSRNTASANCRAPSTCLSMSFFINCADASPSRLQRLEHGMRQARADALPGKVLRDFGVQQDDASVQFLIIGDRDVVLDRHLEAVHGRVVDDLVHAATRTPRGSAGYARKGGG